MMGKKIVLALPIQRDGDGKMIDTYTTQDWFRKIQEEVMEAHEEAIEARHHRVYIDALAEELTDIITVCTSYLHALGYDETARSEMQERVNEKNDVRGYFDSNGKKEE